MRHGSARTQEEELSDIVEVTSSITLIEEMDELSLEDIEITFTGSKPILRLVPPLSVDDEVTTTFIAATPVVSLPPVPQRVLPPVVMKPVLPPLKPPPSSRPPPPPASRPSLSLPPLTLPPRTLPPLRLPPLSGAAVAPPPSSYPRLPPPPSLPPPSRPPSVPPPSRPAVVRSAVPTLVTERPSPVPSRPALPVMVKEETLSEPQMRRPQARPQPLPPEPLVIVRRDEPTRMEPYAHLTQRFPGFPNFKPRRDLVEAIVASLGVVVLVAAGAMFALLMRDGSKPEAPAAGTTAPAMIQQQPMVPTYQPAPPPVYQTAPPPAYYPPADAVTNPEQLPLESAPTSPPTAISPTVASPTYATPVAPRSHSKAGSGVGSGSSSAAGMGTLSFNSLPISAVVLDGRPLGNTPLTGVKVSPGPHNVLFIHPEHGRAARRVTVTAGGHQSVGVRF